MQRTETVHRLIFGGRHVFEQELFCVAGLITLFIAAIIQFGFAELHGDISWLLIVSQKLQNGSTLYVDIFEVNPPFAIALYYPFVWIEQISSLEAEFTITLATFLLYVVNIAIANQLVLKQESVLLEKRCALFFITTLLFFVPTGVFAQREFIGMICFIPFMVLTALKCESSPACESSAPLRALVGALAAIIVCIKPYYALAVLFPALVQMSFHRSIRPAFQIEYLVAASIATLYGAIVWIYFPDYISFASSTLLDIYAGTPADKLMTAGRLVMLIGPATLVGIKLKNKQPQSWTSLGGWAISLGFATACIWQGKGWDYHLFPTLVASLLTIATAFLQAQQHVKLPPLLYGLAIAPIIVFASQSASTNTQFTHELSALDVIPKQRSTITLTQSFKVLHPVSRYLEVDWQGIYSNDWIIGFGLKRLKQSNIDGDRISRITALMHDAREQKRQALALRPEMIIIHRGDTEVLQFFKRDLQISKVLEEYQHYATIGQLSFFVRSPLSTEH